MFWVLLLAVVLAVLIVVDKGLKNVHFEKIPGPPGIFFLENALMFVMDPVKLFYFLRTLANKYKQLFRIKIGPKKFMIIYNPEDVEILISGTKYNSKGFLYGFISDWLKQGLLLSDGPKWHQRRKILTPAFHFNILQHFKTVLEENSWKLVDKIGLEVDQPFTDVRPLISEFTLHSICETAMGTKLDEISTSASLCYKEAIHTLGRLVVYRAQRIWMYPNIIYALTKLGQTQRIILNLMSSFRDSVIEKRRKSNDGKNILIDSEKDVDDILLIGKKRLAMLDLLLQAERDGYIDASGIGEEVDTFMFEGHDTTATALQMIFMLLAYHENSQEKVFEEINNIFGFGSRSATISDLAQMKYLECCIKEGLRLYPPVHFITRRIDVPIKLKNYEAPAGTDCTILIYDLHRRSDQFSEPLQFRPERFLSETPTWHPYAYIPFSAGPRNCIGQKFAMIEMKLAISAVLRRFKLRAVTRPEDEVFITDFILRPNHPIYVKFEKRECIHNT